MTSKEIVEYVDNLTNDEKLKLWLEYVSEMVALNNDFKLIKGKIAGHKYLPIYDVTIFNYMNKTNKHIITPFDSWITQDKNNYNLTGIYAFYRRYCVNKDSKWDKYDSYSVTPSREKAKTTTVIKNSGGSCGCK